MRPTGSRRGTPARSAVAIATALSRLASVWLLAATAAAAAQNGLPGNFAGDGLQVEIQAAGAGYRGTIAQAGQVYPFVAQGGGGRIEGTFQVGASSFAFRAALQGEVLTLETGSARYTLRRTSGGVAGTGGLAGPAAAGHFRAGTQLLYAFDAQFDSGPLGQTGGQVPGQAPSRTGGATTGYERITVVDVDDRRCLVLVTTFTRHPLDGMLFLSGSTPRLTSRSGGSCFYHTDPAALAQMPDAESESRLVGRGPFDHNGRQYQALTQVQWNAAEHISATYDLETGHLLFFRGQTGDLNPQGNPDGQATKPTNVNWLNLQGVRQLDHLWNIGAPLPPNVAAIQELHYRGVRSESYVGVSDLPPLETAIDRRFGVRERGASWLLLETPPNPTPGQQAVLNVLAAGLGYFLPPAALARLQPGQLIDEDTLLGLRTVVAHVDANTVVLSETMRSYHGHATYDKRTGLLIRLESEGSDGSLITRVRLELVGAR